MCEFFLLDESLLCASVVICWENCTGLIDTTCCSSEGSVRTSAERLYCKRKVGLDLFTIVNRVSKYNRKMGDTGAGRNLTHVENTISILCAYSGYK